MKIDDDVFFRLGDCIECIYTCLVIMKSKKLLRLGLSAQI